MARRDRLLRTTLAALCLALCYVLPFLTGQIPEIGGMLCPMHLPVLLCGFLSGWPWGLAVGACAPLLRSLTLGMPPLFPTAVAMAVELAVYGAATGLLHRYLPKKRPYVYLSLVLAMLAGRAAWGLTMLALLGITGGAFTFSAFLAGAFVNAIPGIAVQIVLVPLLVMTLEGPIKHRLFR